jgi:hypothetical protein
MAGLGAVRPIEEILASLGDVPASPPTSPKPRDTAPARPAGRTHAVPPVARAGRPSPVAEALRDVREAILAAVTQARPMLGAILERATALMVDGGTLIVTFGASDAGLRRMLMTDDNVRSIEAIAAETLGRPLALRVDGASETATKGSAAPPPARTAPTQETRMSLEGAGASKQALTERALKDPAVSRFLKEFGAQVVDVRPLPAGADDSAAPLAVEENG